LIRELLESIDEEVNEDEKWQVSLYNNNISSAKSRRAVWDYEQVIDWSSQNQHLVKN
jgi:hypothetical protein